MLVTRGVHNTYLTINYKKRKIYTGPSVTTKNWDSDKYVQHFYCWDRNWD